MNKTKILLAIVRGVYVNREVAQSEVMWTNQKVLRTCKNTFTSQITLKGRRKRKKIW